MFWSWNVHHAEPFWHRKFFWWEKCSTWHFVGWASRLWHDTCHTSSSKNAGGGWNGCVSFVGWSAIPCAQNIHSSFIHIIYTYHIHILYTHIIYIYYNIVIHDYTYFQGTHMVWLRNGALSSPWIPQTLRPPDNCWIVSSCPWCFEIFSPSYPILAILFGFKPPVRLAFLVPMDYPDRLENHL